jgi:hypothetical protein
MVSSSWVVSDRRMAVRMLPRAVQDTAVSTPPDAIYRPCRRYQTNRNSDRNQHKQCRIPSIPGRSPANKQRRNSWFRRGRTQRYSRLHETHKPAGGRRNGRIRALFDDVPPADLIGAAVMFGLGVALLVRAFA